MSYLVLFGGRPSGALCPSGDRGAPATIPERSLGAIRLLVAELEGKSTGLDDIQEGDVRGPAGDSPFPRRDCGEAADSVLRPPAVGPGVSVTQPPHA